MKLLRLLPLLALGIPACVTTTTQFPDGRTVTVKGVDASSFALGVEVVKAYAPVRITPEK